MKRTSSLSGKRKENNLNQESKWVFLALFSWFRFLLWFGVEFVFRTFTQKPHKAHIVHYSRMEWRLPQTIWIFKQCRTYCLVVQRGHQNIPIYTWASMGDEQAVFKNPQV
jgi:hypothetical protein